MQKLTSLEFDIANILKRKETEHTNSMVVVHEENIKFFEEILGKGSNGLFFDLGALHLAEGGLYLINLNKISQEDIIILEECLDYLNIIGD